MKWRAEFAWIKQVSDYRLNFSFIVPEFQGDSDEISREKCKAAAQIVSQFAFS